MAHLSTASPTTNPLESLRLNAVQGRRFPHPSLGPRSSPGITVSCSEQISMAESGPYLALQITHAVPHLPGAEQKEVSPF